MAKAKMTNLAPVRVKPMPEMMASTPNHSLQVRRGQASTTSGTNAVMPMKPASGDSMMKRQIRCKNCG